MSKVHSILLHRPTGTLRIPPGGTRDVPPKEEVPVLEKEGASVPVSEADLTEEDFKMAEAILAALESEEEVVLEDGVQGEESSIGVDTGEGDEVVVSEVTVVEGEITNVEVVEPPAEEKVEEPTFDPVVDEGAEEKVEDTADVPLHLLALNANAFGDELETGAHDAFLADLMKAEEEGKNRKGHKARIEDRIAATKGA